MGGLVTRYLLKAHWPGTETSGHIRTIQIIVEDGTRKYLFTYFVLYILVMSSSIFDRDVCVCVRLKLEPLTSQNMRQSVCGHAWHAWVFNANRLNHCSKQDGSPQKILKGRVPMPLPSNHSLAVKYGCWQLRDRVDQSSLRPFPDTRPWCICMRNLFGWWILLSKSNTSTREPCSNTTADASVLQHLEPRV